MASKATTRKSASRGSRTKPASGKGRQVVPSDALPRRTLSDSLRIATVIRDNYAGKPTAWPEIARALGVSDKNPINRYFLWSAVAYGLVLKHESNTYWFLSRICGLNQEGVGRQVSDRARLRMHGRYESQTPFS
jgi:hypothetical protein